MNPSPTHVTNPPVPALDLTVPTASAAEEGKFHNYVGHSIPWFIRVVWLFFWLLAAWYVITLLLPALDSELLSPP